MDEREMTGYPVLTLMTFGQNLARARRAAGLSQEQLAARLGLKRQNQVSAYEKGIRKPRPETVLRYADALGCAVSVLLEGVVDPYTALLEPGTASVAVPTAPEPESVLMRRAKRLIAKMSDDGQREAVHVLAALARAYPRPPEQRSVAPPERRTEGRARRVNARR